MHVLAVAKRRQPKKRVAMQAKKTKFHCEANSVPMQSLASLAVLDSIAAMLQWGCYRMAVKDVLVIATNRVRRML